MKNDDFAALCEQLQDHRVVDAEQLRRAGADGDAINRARRGPHLQSVPGVSGIYVVGSEAYDELVRTHVAARAAGSRAVVTGIWACRYLKLRWIPETGACMLRVDRDNHRRDAEGFFTLCRTDRLDLVPTWDHEGLQIAGVAQAVVDACRQIPSDRATRHARRPDLDLRDVRGVLLGAVADRRCSPAELESVLSRGSIRWTAHIRTALEDARRGTASPPEAELADGMLPYGVPFACNVEVWRGNQLVGIVDLLLIGRGVGGELDSQERHGDDPLLDRTTRRDDRFKGVDLDLRHRTPTGYRADPEDFHRTLLEAAARRASRGLGDPPGLRFVLRSPVLCDDGRGLPPNYAYAPDVLAA